MAVNRFDKAAEAAFINTYAPIDFGALYQIGAANNAAVEKALKELSTNLAKWSEFQSPSAVDTQKYYDLTVGHLKDTIQKAAENPDFLKTAAGRAELQGMINSVDYASLNQLKQSADNLRAGLEMRAKMKAEGRYNKDWDKTDIANYDTLLSGKVFTDITPTRYMSANELSSAYYDNLSKGYIDSVWIDGVKYDRIGNTTEDLEAVYDRFGTDMMNSDQGQAYIDQFIRSGMDRETAESKFRDMIIGSQMDRVIRPKYEVNRGWELEQAVRKATGKPGGKGDYTGELTPNRYDLWNYSGLEQQSTGMLTAIKSLLKDDNDGKFSGIVKEIIAEYTLGEDTKKAVKARELAEEYRKEGDTESANVVEAIANQATASSENKARVALMKALFEKKAHFSPDDMGEGETYKVEEISTVSRRTPVFGTIVPATGNELIKETRKKPSKYEDRNYNQGVKAALEPWKYDGGFQEVDAAFAALGASAIKDEIVDVDGSKKIGYHLANTKRILLPEQLFAQLTDTKERPSTDEVSTLNAAIAGGFVNNVEFIPTTGEIYQKNYGANEYLVHGVIRIPEEEFERAGNISWTTSNKKMVEKRYNGREVEQRDGEDTRTYYELESYLILPSSNAYKGTHSQLYYQAPNEGGVASSAKAKEEYDTNISRYTGNL